jgi:predicted permease
MRLLSFARSIFRSLFRRRQIDADLDDEIRCAVELLADQKVKEGLSPGEAGRAARIELGGVEQLKETVRSGRAAAWLESLLQDLRFAFRMLGKSPGFTAVAVLTLALGIGANVLVFSAVNALILRPLPVKHAEQLVFLETKQGPSQSFPNYRDLRDRNSSFAGLAGYRISPMELESSEGAVRIWGYLATGNYFDVIGVTPLIGRFFQMDDDLHPGASPYAVLSYGCWKARFGGDPEIVGKTIRINRRPYTVLGVARREFHGTELFYWPDVWVPMMMQAQIEVGNPWLENRATFDTWVIGRLKPGIASPRAAANLNTIAKELARQYPMENAGLQLKLTRPGLIGDAIGSPARAFAFGVWGLAGLVLLAACANLASLLTARAADRQREIAIRLSMGAKRGRVMRQLLTETLVLSVIGGTAGYGLATFLAAALSQWHAPMDFPVQFNVSPDWRVFFFGFGASAVVGILFGAAPAWNASETDPNAVLRGAQSERRGRWIAFRDLLVAMQVALCFVLVSGCLLSLHGLQQSMKIRLGFEPGGVSAVAFDLGLAGYTEQEGRDFQRRALAAVELLPGTQFAAFSNSLPLSIDQSRTWIFTEGQPNSRPSDAGNAVVYEVSPGFFRTLSTRMLSGRDFGWQDDRNAPLVAVVNVAFGKQILHMENPIGKRFRQGPDAPLVEIIGVVENGKYESLTEEAEPALYFPILQHYNATTTLTIRSVLPEAQMVAQMREALTRLDSQMPLYGSGSLNQMLGFAFFPTRAAAIALSAFGVLAIMLAATGLYGLLSYAVARRVREIGIRVAVGATPDQVIRLVLTRTIVLLLVGCVIGFVLALAGGQVLASIVYEVSPRDPAVLAVVWLTILCLGVLSCLGPTRRALRADPMVALRHE